MIHTSESETSSLPVGMGAYESDEDYMPPFARMARGGVPSDNELPYETTGSLSGRGGHLMDSTRSKTLNRHPSSLRCKGLPGNMFISAGTSLQSSTISRRHHQQERESDSYDMEYALGSTSVSSVSTTTRSGQRPPHLRNRIPRGLDDDKKVHELFKYTRARLGDLAHGHRVGTDRFRVTSDDLRRQMLSTIFGWHKEIGDLVYDEMSRHPKASTSRILLAKWLGEMENDILAASSKNMTSSDWALLAMSSIGRQTSQQKLVRTYVQRLLEAGDIHVAVTIMLGMGDDNDAIEVYISHKRYMEALILTCLTFPSVWERQVDIVRKWGEWAVKHGQRQLAIRCFACTEKEPTETWTSPSATQLNFQSIGPELLSLPLSPLGLQRGPQRSLAKTSALKLITSFDNHGSKPKFYNQNGDGQTPIAESAVSPGEYEAVTAFLCPSNNSQFNTPTSKQPSDRSHLLSMGEMPSDLSREVLKAQHDREIHTRKSSTEQNFMSVGISLQRAETASPLTPRDDYQPMLRGFEREGDAEGDRPPSPTQNFLTKAQYIRRNGSRDRIPQGLKFNLELQPDTFGPFDHQMENVSTQQSGTSSAKFHWPSRRRGPGSATNSVTSASSVGRRDHGGNRQWRDGVIYSLDTPQMYSIPRNASCDRETRPEQSTAKFRGASEDYGRAAGRKWDQTKHSLTSPAPMSPKDIANMSPHKPVESEALSTVRKMSSSRRLKQPKSHNSSRGSRRQNPGPTTSEIDIRGRSKGRNGSPVPLSATTAHYQGSEDEDDYQRAVQAQLMFRARHNKSTSQGHNSGGDVPSPIMSHKRATSTKHAGDLRQMKEVRQRKKEQAARELEDRRASLANRAHAPGTHYPSPYSSSFPRVGPESMDSAQRDDFPPRCATGSHGSVYASTNSFHIGLPATLKASCLRMGCDCSFGNGHGNQSESGHSPGQSPKASPGPPPKKGNQGAIETKGKESLLTLLPSTVYQPQNRPMIPRSMSAPIPDEPSPRFRKGSAVGLQGTDEFVPYTRSQGARQHVPAHPVVNKLAEESPKDVALPAFREYEAGKGEEHNQLPSASALHARRLPESFALGSSPIETVMVENEESSNEPPGAALEPALRGHSRGRSQGDTASILGRLCKATGLRSSGKGRKDGDARSPQVSAHAGSAL
jgi:hypothetical protein